jgi:serine/threonine-protein kinase RsbW
VRHQQRTLEKVPNRSLQFEIAAHPQYAGEARDRVRHAGVEAGLSARELDDIEIAVGEAVTNAILYGSPSEDSRIVIFCRYSPSENVFHVEVRDQGQGFDPKDIRSDENAEMLGGRGIRLMRALMDKVDLKFSGSGMVVCLSKKHTV